MKLFFGLCLLAVVLLSVPLLIMIFREKGFYNRFAAVAFCGRI